MSLVTSILGNLAGHLVHSGGTGGNGGILPAVSGFLTQCGGIEGLKSKFSENGLDDVFASWVGTGENLPISPVQIQSVLGSGQLQTLASQIGIDATQVASFLSSHLPGIVDKLTPSGTLDGSANLQSGLASLLQGASGLLGGKSDGKC